MVPPSKPREWVRAGVAGIDRRGRRLDAPAVLSYGFRPFFLAGAAYAAVSVPLWLAILFVTDVPTGAFSGARSDSAHPEGDGRMSLRTTLFRELHARRSCCNISSSMVWRRRVSRA